MSANNERALDELLISIRGEPSKKSSGKYKTKEEWSAAVNKYKKEHGTTRGFQEGKLQYIDSDGKPWSYAAGTRGGPGHPRSASSTTAYTDRRNQMEVSQTLGADDLNSAKRQFNQAGRNAGVKAGTHQMHHMRTLNQYEPLLAGLDDKEYKEALEWFKSEGHPLGNSEGNLKIQYNNQKAGGTTIANTHQGLGSIHEWMRENRLEPDTKQKEYKQIAAMFEGKPLKERLPMYVQYLDNIQSEVQDKLQEPTLYTKRKQLENKVGKIESGPRAGQRLPVNRATLADAIIRETRGPNPVKPALKIKPDDIPKGALSRKISRYVPIAGAVAPLFSAGDAFAKGNHVEGVAHLAGAAVGEIPIIGDVAVESVAGSPVGDGTLAGAERTRLQIQQREQQRQARKEHLKANPSQERGYETIRRGLTSIRDKLKSFFK